MSNPATGVFYFICDSYFSRFPDHNLLQNKGIGHSRPCFYAFMDKRTGLYWMIPISSRTEKYHQIANRKAERYGFCNTILFGEVLGQERAFLIQNMFPVTPDFIDQPYINPRDGSAVRVAKSFARQLISSANAVLKRQRHGIPLIFPDVLSIEEQLLR